MAREDDASEERTEIVTVPTNMDNRIAPLRPLCIPLKRLRAVEVLFPADLSPDDFDFVIEVLKLWKPNITQEQRHDSLDQGPLAEGPSSE